MKTVPQSPGMVKEILKLVEAHREAFGQERVYLRVMGLVVGEMLAFCGHRVTDLLRALGCTEEDWTAWYRIFQQPQRYAEEQAAVKLLEQTLEQVPGSEVYTVGIDTTSIARDSAKLEGTSWLKCPRNPAWKVSIHRGQRFLNGSWLTPVVDGFSRAIPLRFLPAFPEKAVTTQQVPQKEHLAGLDFVHWLRNQMDKAGRQQQSILCLADGSYDKPDFWSGLPAGVFAVVRTAKNRALCSFPDPYAGKGRRRVYGDPAPAPQSYLADHQGWRYAQVTVRGHQRHMVYRVEGPFLRRGMAAVPLMLICIRGQAWQRSSTRKRRLPVFYLVNAVLVNSEWQLPLSVETLLAWAWQRWELEVVHREVKSVFGLGDKQCFHPHAAIASVQWSAWVYALLMLTAYRIYGVATAVPRHTAWQRHPRRFSIVTVLNQCRLELLSDPLFSPLFSASSRNWPEMEAFLRTLSFHSHLAIPP